MTVLVKTLKLKKKWLIQKIKKYGENYGAVITSKSRKTYKRKKQGMTIQEKIQNVLKL